MTTDNKYPYIEAQKDSGDWNPVWDLMMEMDKNYLEKFLAFRSIPLQKGPLEQKYKELIFIALNASTTHLHAPGIKRHMQYALNAGATKEEILEVLQISSIIGIHSMTMGVPILKEELDKL